MERGPELLRLRIWGQAYGAGSKTAEPLGKTGREVRDRNGRIVLKYRHASKFTAPWMELVQREAEVAWARRAPLDGALWLDAFFYECRPSTHYFKRKAGDVLRPDAPAYPDATESHDVDKMRRAISDSLTNAKVIVDDKRIVGGEAWKDFAENRGQTRPLCVITLGRMDYATAEEAGFSSPAPPGQAALV